MNPAAYREMAELQDRHWWYLGRRRVVAAVLASLELPRETEVLEVGAGTGGNLPLLQSFGRVSAIEMNEYARAWASQRAERPVLAGRLPDQLPVADASFDLICLFDVLEHVADDVAALAALRRKLKPAGRILLTVPALPWLWSAHDVFLHHHRRYGARSLREAAANAGLRLRRLSGFNTILLPLAVLARLWDRLRGRTQASGTALPPAWINRILGATLAAEAHWLRHADLPFGLSWLAVLEAG